MNSLKETALEVIQSVIPITTVIIIIQIVLKMSWEDFSRFFLGALFVSFGLMLFFLGTKIGIVPLGEMIGEYLPNTGKISLIIFFGFILGFAVTIAEPDVQILATQADMVSGGEIPKIVLITTIAIGVGIFVTLGLLKQVKGIHIKYFLIPSYFLVFILALFTRPDFIPIAMDSGGVTTGPITVPFILALGIGVASAFTGKRDSFGFVGLASVGPILALLLLGVVYK